MAKIDNWTNRYLDALSLAMDGASDYRLAQVLGVNTSAISNYRNRGGGFDNKMAFKIAGLLNLDPLDVIVNIEWDRAKDAREKDFWANHASGKVAGIALGASILLASVFPENAHAFSGLESEKLLYVNIHYKLFRSMDLQVTKRVCI
jgi:transcriptional regulator with XRE-family HTH domain